MIISERSEGSWPYMITTNELKLKMFKGWLEGSSYCGCTSVCEYEHVMMPVVILIIDCDSSAGRSEILDWWITIGCEQPPAPIPVIYDEKTVSAIIIKIAKGILSNKTWKEGEQVVDDIPISTCYVDSSTERKVIIHINNEEIEISQIHGLTDHVGLFRQCRSGVVKVTPFHTLIQW